MHCDALPPILSAFQALDRFRVYRHIPNLITIARLVLTVVFFAVLNVNERDTFSRQMWTGFVVFVIAGGTDVLDGYLARAWKVESAFGRVVDPFVDKILICGAFIFFSSNHFISVAAKDLFPDLEAQERAGKSLVTVTGVLPWMAVVLIGREFLITSIRGLAESRGINFRADWAGKIKMFSQSFAVGAVMVDLALLQKVAWVHIVRDIAIWITVVVTVLSATTYIVRARKMLTE